VFELGDTYAGSGGGGGDYSANGLREGQPSFDGSGRRIRQTRRETFVLNDVQPPPRQILSDAWPLDKSLALVPQLFAFTLAYGFNPLTGRETDRWRVRNIVRWCRPNPPVGALGDKFRPATSEMIVACKARDRYFDLDATREPHQHPNATHTVGNVADTRGDYGDPTKRIENNPAGAPPLDWWEIPTAAYRGSHYATYPPALCIKPILAMCPERVCTVCGRPSRRIVETEYEPNRNTNGPQSLTQRAESPGHAVRADRVTSTLGWTDCGHDNWRPGHVIDVFAGSGTTLAVAHGHGRDATGVDLDPRNAELAYGRLGLFLEVVTHSEAVA